MGVFLGGNNEVLGVQKEEGKGECSDWLYMNGSETIMELDTLHVFRPGVVSERRLVIVPM